MLCALPAATFAAGLPVFDGKTGSPLESGELLARIDSADVVLFAEVHSDAAGHRAQYQILEVLAATKAPLALSLEEFDRSQQSVLDLWSAGRLSDAGLYEERVFVNLKVKRNWNDWSLPKLRLAREHNMPLVAANAPLKYSRMVRNAGCDNLPELTGAESRLFDCPSVPFDPAYYDRFLERMQRVAEREGSGLKVPDEGVARGLFRAHRVWDATMAASIVAAAGQRKVVHIVGNFHTDFNGGLLQELQVRDPELKVLTVSFYPRRLDELAAPDVGRADIVVYTKNIQHNIQ